MRHGISLDHNGFFYFASVKNTAQEWKLHSLKKWNSHSQLRNYLLLHRSVSLALPGNWVREVNSDYDTLLCTENEDAFTFCTNNTEFEYYSSLITGNLDGVYPDDALLSSLPVHFDKETPDSFITLLHSGNIVKIGITIDDTLRTVFHCIASSERELIGYLGRIERYWKKHFPSDTFPSEIYTLNHIPILEESTIPIRKISAGTDNPSELAAIGSALCGITPGIPQIAGASPESRFRILRSILLNCAVILIILSIAAATAVTAYKWKLGQSVTLSKERYQHILSSNKEIRDLINEGNTLAEKVLRINSIIAHSTRWAPFLQFLGTSRPSGLFLERLGSEPSEKSVDEVRIALAGWCENETIVTEFIGSLKKSSQISDVTLSSMERVKEHKSLCRFKIICLLHI